jgi:uncharacterized membrane protein YphA (DoxX/SURF4 family)
MKKNFASKLFRFTWSVGLAVLLYFICPPCFSKTTLLVLLAIQLILINAADFIGKITILTHILRILVGGLFIFSGFIKANDPVGFSYKLQEYFEVFTADTGWGIFEYFANIALPLAVILCASEIILGAMLLIGFKSNLTVWLLFAQIAFFTFLTFYSACYNKVTTCGCFGDFLVLKPWTSFWKDIALLILITLLFAGRQAINPLTSPLITNTLFILLFAFSIWFPIYAIRNLPPLDFRAYKIGNNIKEKMKKGEGYQDAVIETGFIYENLKTGEKKHFDIKNYPWQDTLNWKWFATDNVVIKEAVNPPKITDFTVNNSDGVSITESLLNDKNYSFWLIIYDINNATDNETVMAKINDFYKLASQNRYNVIALTASSWSDIDKFKHKHNLLVDFALVDGTVLKTMIRSNPGLMLIKDGTVIMNWHYNNFPTFSDAKQKYMK